MKNTEFIFISVTLVLKNVKNNLYQRCYFPANCDGFKY